MASNSDEFTKSDSLYTLQKKLIIKISKSSFISEIVQIASSLSINLDYIDLSNIKAPKLFFLYQSLNGSSFEDSYIPSSRFGKCLMENSNFNNSVISGSDMRKTVFTGSSFNGCNMRGSNMQHSFFIDCDFTDANISDCDLRNSVFVNSNFTKADLRGSNLEGVDLSTCKKDLIKITKKEKIQIFKLI